MKYLRHGIAATAAACAIAAGGLAFAAPASAAETVNYVDVSGSVTVRDDDYDHDEYAFDTFSGHSGVDAAHPIAFYYGLGSECAGGEAWGRVTMDVSRINATSVWVKVGGELYEGASCGTIDKDGRVFTQWFKLSSGYQSTGTIVVPNQDEGGDDSFTVRFTVRHRAL